ncbi:MAG: hypothetical protein PVH04_04340 [Gammaproteobacteria bacterium]
MRGVLLCGIALLLFMGGVCRVNASQQVLKDIKIERRDENTTHYSFDFGIPLNYVKHFPAKTGEILQIQMLMDEDQGREIHKEVRQGKELAAPDGFDQLLIYVTYEEGVPGGPYLTLRFARPVSFDVQAGDSLTSLSIVVHDDQMPKREPLVADKTEEEEAEVAAPGTPTPPPTPPKGPEISLKTLEGAVSQQAEKSAEQLEKQREQQQAKQEPTKDKPGDQQTQPPAAQEGGTGGTTLSVGPAAVPRAGATRPSIPLKSDKEVDELMAKARQALTFGDNDSAIRLLRRIVAMPENEHTRDARELIGLALERSNQIPRAKFEYKKYLKLYKEGDGTTRVRQRLQALQSVATERRKKLRRTTRRSETSITTFGRWSQAFTTRFQQREPENDDDRVGSEDIVLTRRIDSHLSVRSRMRTEDRNIQAVFTGNQVFDLIDSEETENRVSSLYLDYDAFKDGYYTILGRQRVRNSGVFSRFDGGIVGYDFLPWMRGHVYVGQPVELNDDRNIDNNFWGLKVDVGRRNDAVNMNLYMTNQSADGYADRQAFGAGVRYNDDDMTLFGLLDYDFLFDEINLFNFRWGWNYLENTKLNISYNYRQLLFLTSALNNQPITTTLDQLIAILGEDAARELAADRTNASSTLTIGNSHQFDRDNQLNVDLTLFESSGTETRNDLNEQCADPNNCPIIDVTGAPSTDTQFTLSGQWISGNLFAQRDLYVFGLRLSKFDSYNDVTMFANARLPDFDRWKPRPRLNVSYRSFNEDNDSTSTGGAEGTRISIAPSVKVDYAWKKEWVFDIELGFEWVQYSDERFDDEARQNVRLGYSYSF